MAIVAALAAVVGFATNAFVAHLIPFLKNVGG